jgi:FMN-dependent NADH-azoreductase
MAHLPTSISTGVEPRFITVELTLADINPAMSKLIRLAHKSRANAGCAIDELWHETPQPV